MSTEAEKPCAGGVFRAEPGKSGAAFEDDAGNVDQGLDIVHGSRLAEQSRLRRERRLVARLAAKAFDRVKQRGLLAADIRAGTPANFHVEVQAASQNVVAEKVV